MYHLLPEDHGLGVNRAIPTRHVEEFEHRIMHAAMLANDLGVSCERFLELCEGAMDVDLCERDEKGNRVGARVDRVAKKMDRTLAEYIWQAVKRADALGTDWDSFIKMCELAESVVDLELPPQLAIADLSEGPVRKAG